MKSSSILSPSPKPPNHSAPLRRPPPLLPLRRVRGSCRGSGPGRPGHRLRQRDVAPVARARLDASGQLGSVTAQGGGLEVWSEGSGDWTEPDKKNLHKKNVPGFFRLVIPSIRHPSHLISTSHHQKQSTRNCSNTARTPGTPAFCREPHVLRRYGSCCVRRWALSGGRSRHPRPGRNNGLQTLSWAKPGHFMSFRLNAGVQGRLC